MVTIIEGDLLQSEAKYLVHQTNCVSQGSAGLAAAIFTQYPYSNIYLNRVKPHPPGEIVISGNGQDQRYIVNLMGQIYPGAPTGKSMDDDKSRQKYFHQGLLKLAKVPNLTSVAFPFNIGCGLARGNWEYYLGCINSFAKYILEQQQATTTIYRI